jgi:predicted signal transduction protein with EAL and GGDEF domain
VAGAGSLALSNGVASSALHDLSGAGANVVGRSFAGAQPGNIAEHPVSSDVSRRVIDLLEMVESAIATTATRASGSMRALGTQNIEYGQGYLYGRPAPATLIEPESARAALA